MLRHARGHHRNCQPQTHPESKRHRSKLGVVFLFRRHRPRLKSHAADGAVSRLITDNLGMHGANVLGPCGWQRAVGRLQRHSAFWAAPGSRLTYFGMHWARKFGRTPGWGSWRRTRSLHSFLARLDIGLGIGLEFAKAGLTAEQIAFAFIIEASGGLAWFHCHAANRVNSRQWPVVCVSRTH